LSPGTIDALTLDAMSAATSPTLCYQSGAERRLLQKRWLGITSLALWSRAVLFAGVCFIAANRSTGWDGLGWIVAAFLGSWIGCGLGILFASIGTFPRRRRHRFALTGLILNLLTGLGPVTLIWASSVLS
jgi:hypothetical protein